MKRSWLWAGLFALAAAGWLASGQAGLPTAGGPPAPAPGRQKPPQTKPQTKERPFRVEVLPARISERRAVLTFSAHTEAGETVMARARTGGVVLETPAEEGAAVKKGDVLCRLDPGARPARLAAAKAAAASALRDYRAGTRLHAGGHMPQARLKQLRAALDAAQAQVRQIELEIGYTQVRAPLDGVLARQAAKRGDLLAPGAPCALVVSLDPLKVTADASEREVGRLARGMTAKARLVTGETLRGRITFIAPQAEAATRTFRIEMTAPNPALRARAGVTARLSVPLPPVKAALTPLAAVGLNDAGELGVHIVRADDTVAFVPVRVLEETREGAWVKGLQEGARVIVSGQHYVLPGQKVTPVPFRPGGKGRT